MDVMPYVISSLLALVICTIIGSVIPPVITYILITICSIFMIFLVLIQRGRGGGLAGAFGGVGGSSAFGTRAGDVFTRITIVTASVWIALNMGLVMRTNQEKGVQRSALDPEGGATAPAPATPGEGSDLSAAPPVPADLGGDAPAGAPTNGAAPPDALPEAFPGGEPAAPDTSGSEADTP